MSDTLERTEVDIVTDIMPYDDTEDGNTYLTHIINPPANIHIWREGMTSQDVVDIARATGQHVTALCGYSWVPKRNPDKYDVCQVCMDKAGDIMRSLGE